MANRVKYINYELTNIEPIRIADESTSQRGQTQTLTYIPGSTIRGVVVNAMAKAGNLETIKKQLFSSNCRFLNAYRVAFNDEGKVVKLFPSPKGFYEDKTESKEAKEIENVVINGEVNPGNKRARMGKYAYIKDNCIVYYGVNTGSEMLVTVNGDKNNKDTLIRTEYIEKGYTFSGSIAVENEEIAEEIENTLKELDNILIGNARTKGMGKCEINILKGNDFPYIEYEATENQKGECYMMLLSGMTMRNDIGEYTGINLQELEGIMGISNLDIKFCSTATIDIMGYNRMLGGKIPSVKMYDAGSVFHLSYDGEFDTEHIQLIEDTGIGVRRNEGFGQVLFFDKEFYECISSKKKGEDKENNKEKGTIKEKDDDKDVLKNIARIYCKQLIQKNIQEKIIKDEVKGIKGVSSSQLGVITSIADTYRYNPEEGINEIKKHLKHAGDKSSNQKQFSNSRTTISNAEKWINSVLNMKVEDFININGNKKSEIMGFDASDLINFESIKLEYIVEAIRYNNRTSSR